MNAAASPSTAPGYSVLRLPLKSLLPDVYHPDDGCVARLVEGLRHTAGVRAAELVVPPDGEPAVEVVYDASVVARDAVRRAAASRAEQLRRRFRHERLRVVGMDCRTCAGSIEHLLARVAGITAVAVDYPSGTATVEYDPGRVRRRDIVRRIEALGYTVDGSGRLRRWLASHRELAVATAAGLLALAGWLQLRLLSKSPQSLLPHLGELRFLGWLCLAGAYVLAGWPAAASSWTQLRRGRFDVDLLMVLAAAGAAAIGEAAEGAALLVIFALGHALEHEATGRARAAIRALAELAPRTARLVRDGREMEVPVQEVRRGDRLVVRPGERVPVDGKVVRGSGWVDESAVTGEPLPREKAPGDPIYAGSVNGDRLLELEATRLSGESTLARMARLVEEARARPSGSHRLAARLAGVLVPAVLAGAALVALAGPAAAGWSWKESLYRALSLLVAASPCALAVGPPAAVAALAAAARQGILVKGAAVLEALGTVRAAAFDKTGTLTVGRPRVQRVLALPGYTEAAVLEVAAAAESASTHPLAGAVVAEAAARGLRLPGAVEEAETLRGQGVRARVDGREVRVGTAAFAFEGRRTGCGRAGNGTPVPPLALPEDPTVTRLFVSLDGRPVGVIEVQDPVREEAAEALAALRQAGVQAMVLISGDRAEVARHVAAQLGVGEVVAPVLPHEKLQAVEALKRRYGSVLVVGDGINDGAALAAATVGVAMEAAGSDVALEAAHAALMGSDLRLLPRAMALARACRRVTLQNLTLAMAVMGLLVAAVLSGRAGIGLTVTVHEASTVLVALNGLRLLAWRPATR